MNPEQVLKPCVTHEMAKEFAARLYGLEVIALKEMVSFDDKNFHIMVSPTHSNPYIDTIWQHGYTLKITNTGKSSADGHFDSMHNVMKHMNKKGMRLPFPIRNLKGNTWTLEKMPVRGGTLKDPSEEEKKGLCGVHLLTYIPGVPVGTVKHTKNLLFQWGKLLGSFHNGLQDYNCSIMEKKAVYWDLSHVPEVKKFMEGLSDRETSLIKEVLDKFPHGIYSDTSSVRKGLLHGDFNENNILVQVIQESGSDTKYIVDGILDLEDMHFGPYVWDIGVMLGYTMLNCDELDPIEGVYNAMAGYFTLRSLNPEELSLVKICTASRLTQSYVLTGYSYKLDPENSYCILAHENKWSSLCALWNTPDDVFVKKLEAICETHKSLNNSVENQVT